MKEQEFLQRIHQKYENADLIEKAYFFAKEKHAGQKRDSGEPYIIHPMAVANILIDLRMDATIVIAALLHDTIEDTKTTYKEIKELFGKEVEMLVKGLTKVGIVKLRGHEEEQQKATLRRMLLTMGKDVRVVIIKLADRLHNMRTLNYKSREKQIKIAKETKEIFVPLCERIGVCSIRAEMDDLCLYYLHPEEYKKLEAEIERKFEKRQIQIKRITHELEALLKKLHIQGEVNGRFKHISSIYRKQVKKEGIEKIYDIIGLRIMVQTVPECYSVLGAVHNHWKPLSGRIKDYIANPKPNGYQSLHTTCLLEDGTPFEVQIRTFDMHKICEYGLAAHWRYKGGSADALNLESKLDTIKQIVENNKNTKNPDAFIKNLQFDLSVDRIWTFTPNRKVIELKEQSTPIDFAYAIHSDLGHNCMGAKVNGKLVPLTTPLQSGDMVEIITSPQPKAPSRDWLNIVKTSQARNRIRSYFRNMMKDENIKTGKTMLEAEAKTKGLPLNSLLTEETFALLQKTYNFANIDELYASIGAGSLTSHQIIQRLLAEKRNQEKQEKKMAQTGVTPTQLQSVGGVLVCGEANIPVKLAKCCSPVPGDEIVGYSVGRGITIHRVDCKNCKNIAPERKLNVCWANANTETSFEAQLHIYAQNITGLMNKITTLISMANIPIVQIQAKTNPNQTAYIKLSVMLKQREQIRELINKLSQIEGIIEVKR